MNIDIGLVGRISGKFQVGKADLIDGHLIRTNSSWCLEVLRARVGHVIVLINTVAADTEASNERAVFVQRQATGEKHDPVLMPIRRL